MHDLRHTSASLALGAGVPLLVVSRRLGHSTIAVTADIYGHLLKDADPAAAAAISDVIPSARPAVSKAAS